MILITIANKTFIDLGYLNVNNYIYVNVFLQTKEAYF